MLRNFAGRSGCSIRIYVRSSEVEGEVRIVNFFNQMTNG